MPVIEFSDAAKAWPAYRLAQAAALKERNLVYLDRRLGQIVLNDRQDPNYDLSPGTAGYGLFLPRMQPADFYRRLMELREKTWFTTQMLLDFLEVFERALAICKNPHDARVWNWDGLIVESDGASDEA